MYKNLLVHIPTERSARPAVDGSVSLAMYCGAHLDAIATGFSRVNSVPFVAEGGAAVASIIELEYERAMERAQAAVAVFETEAKGAEISYDTRALVGSFGDIVATAAAADRQAAADVSPHLSWCIQGGAHRYLLGRKPSRRSRSA
jgi:hypothetical protein